MNPQKPDKINILEHDFRNKLTKAHPYTSILFGVTVPKFLDLALDLDLKVIPSRIVRVEMKQKTFDL